MPWPHILGIIAGIFLIIGYIPYIYDVCIKKTIPNRVSWFIWLLSTIISLLSLHSIGAHDTIWTPIADAIGCSLIFILSIFKGKSGWTKVDIFSLIIAVVSLLCWLFTGNPILTLILNLIIYTSGYIPTIKKSIKNPQNESLTAWTFFYIGVLLNLIVVIFGKNLGFAIWMYPVVLNVTVGTLYFFLIRKFFK